MVSLEVTVNAPELLVQLTEGSMHRSHTFSHCVHAVVKLNIRLATTAYNDVTDSGLFDPDWVREPASRTINIHLEVVEIQVTLLVSPSEKAVFGSTTDSRVLGVRNTAVRSVCPR